MTSAYLIDNRIPLFEEFKIKTVGPLEDDAPIKKRPNWKWLARGDIVGQHKENLSMLGKRKLMPNDYVDDIEHEPIISVTKKGGGTCNIPIFGLCI